MSTTYDFGDPRYLDLADTREELDRVFDLCHGCRLCFDLCPSFGSLFKLVDEKTDGMAVHLSPDDQDRVVDECYQCKLCYLKCPYIPPHDWQLDFPRLMLRGLAARTGGKPAGLGQRLLAATDCAGRMATATSGIANASLKPGGVPRRVMQKAVGISSQRLLPPYAKQRFTTWWKKTGRQEPVSEIPVAGAAATEAAPATRPGFLEPTEDELAAARPGAPGGVQVSGPETGSLARAESGAPPTHDLVIFPTCLVEYQDPDVGKATVRVLRRNGCDVDCATGARCCGMPSLDGGDVKGFLEKAAHNVAELLPAVREGRKVIVAQPTCAYVLRNEYPEYLGTPEAREVGAAVMDPAEYLLALREAAELDTDFPVSLGTVGYHAACHMRAQGQGYKGRDLLRLVPGTTVKMAEGCTGIDGTWGYRAENYEMAKEVIAPTAARLRDAEADVLVGDCHLSNWALAEEDLPRPVHPMQALARAYGIPEE